MQKLAVNVVTPIGSVNVVDDLDSLQQAPEQAEPDSAMLAEQKEQLIQAGRAMEQAAVSLQNFQEEIFSSHREQIIRLSVEIARKILSKEIENEGYDITAILSEAMKAAPPGQKVIVHLNPEDMELYMKTLEEKQLTPPGNIELISDMQIGRAECIVETDRGMIECFIQEHLKQIEEALKAGNPG
jgi:flagellar assembly protein FliH